MTQLTFVSHSVQRNPMMINFRDIAGDRARNISGHERGSLARQRFGLDAADQNGDLVDIFVPDDIDAIASSFFQGMFSKSVKYYKSREEFLKHYRFNASPVIMEQVIRGIDRAMTARGGSAFQ